MKRLIRILFGQHVNHIPYVPSVGFDRAVFCWSCKEITAARGHTCPICGQATLVLLRSLFQKAFNQKLSPEETVVL